MVNFKYSRLDGMATSSCGDTCLKTGLFYDERMLLHRCLWDDTHIEKPERLEKILAKLKQLHLPERCLRIDGRMAAEDELLLCHPKSLIDTLSASSTMTVEEQEQLSSQYEDIFLSKESFELALLSAGSAIASMEAVLNAK